jgi:hypothetical protein
MRVCRRCRMGINQPCQVSWAHFISRRHRGAAIPRKCAKLLPNPTGGPQPALDVGVAQRAHPHVRLPVQGVPEPTPLVVRFRASQGRRRGLAHSG